MAAVMAHSDLGAEEKKVCHRLYVSPSICDEVMEPDAMILVFWMLSFKLLFHSSFTLIRLAWVQIPALFFAAQLSDLGPVNCLEPLLKSVVMKVFLQDCH